MSLADASSHAVEPVTQSFSKAMASMRGFETSPTIAVAVSGGADSMALLLLAKDWAAQHGGLVIALTVDHGLRPESADEAKQVASYCAALGIAHHTLSWNPPALSSSIQAEARIARYRLLSSWCKAHGVLHLLTAHHQDDQAETLFFRLARGSGLDGLSSIAALTHLPHIRILRPLLDVPAASLRVFLSQRNQSWIEDPTNQSLRYTRNLIRSHMQHSDNQGTIAPRAATLAARLANIRSHMEKHTASYITNCVTIYPEGYATIDHSGFIDMPCEYQFRMLSSLLQTLSGDSYPLRTQQLETLCTQLSTDHDSASYTLGGFAFIYQPANTRRAKARWLVTREMHAIAPAVPLSTSQPTCWDGRFVLTPDNKDSAVTELYVTALGMEGKRIIKHLNHKHPLLAEQRVLPSLPALWHLEELVYVPHIQYHHPDYTKMHCFIAFLPAKSLAASAFSGMNNL